MRRRSIRPTAITGRGVVFDAVGKSTFGRYTETGQKVGNVVISLDQSG